MKIDLNKGAYIQIEGELGKYNSLTVDVLAKIAQDFQALIMSIAINDLETNDPIDYDIFKIELLDFRKGSAVPSFGYSPRTENKVGHNWQSHRNQINDKFNELAEIASTGNYLLLNDRYKNPIIKNAVTESLYNFVNNFNNSPVAFVNYDISNSSFIKISAISKFKKSVKDEIITEITDIDFDKVVNEVPGIVRLTTKGKKTQQKIIKTYNTQDFILSYAPKMITFNDIKYLLRYPLRSLLEKEEDYYIIQSEILDIIGTGLTVDDAELSFAEEFNYIFNKLNSLNDDQLTEHNNHIKLFLNSYIKEIEQ